MLISCLNDLDIQLILEFKSIFENNIQSFLKTPCIKKKDVRLKREISLIQQSMIASPEKMQNAF